MDSTWQGTVLLADLRRDASRLYQTAGPTKALHAIRECVALLEQAAWEGGATLVRSTGDEVMALFPAPAAAADAASAMQLAAESLPPVGATKLGVRIAFQTGPVVVRNGDVLGETVTMASRLIAQSRAKTTTAATATAAMKATLLAVLAAAATSEKANGAAAEASSRDELIMPSRRP